jgi:hypothetical protein
MIAVQKSSLGKPEKYGPHGCAEVSKVYTTKGFGYNKLERAVWERKNLGPLGQETAGSSRWTKREARGSGHSGRMMGYSETMLTNSPLRDSGVKRLMVSSESLPKLCPIAQNKTVQDRIE